MELTRVYAEQTAAARCSFEPQGEFNAIWNQAQVQHTLGCPVDVNPVSSWFGEQEFDKRGYMYWSQVHDLYFVVFYDDPSGEQGTWLVYKNSDVPNINPSGTACKSDLPSDPAGIQPVRGFGGVWCALDFEDRQKLGYATQPEQGVSGNLLQEFENGFILRDSRGVTYVLYKDGTYTVVGPGPTPIIPTPSTPIPPPTEPPRPIPIIPASTPTKPPLPADAQIAFVSTRRGGSDLFVVGVNGEGEGGERPARYIRLESCDEPAKSCEAGRPRFSPDGELFLFHAEVPRPDRPEELINDIFRVRLLASNRARVEANLTQEYRGLPYLWDQMEGTWSPDGDKIAFLSTYEDLNRIWLMDVNGQNKSPLTSGRDYKDEQPVWSPTGDWIAIASQKIGNDANPWEIWLIDPETGERQVQVTANKGFSRSHWWSPDGTQLVFARGQEEAEDICIINWDGTGQVCRRTLEKEDLPTWSPDGNWIAFHRIVGDTYRTEIFVMRSDFTDERRLTYNTADDWGPMWMPQ